MVQEDIAIETEHPDLSMVTDTHPNTAWAFAHRRRYGVFHAGSWLKSVEGGAPVFTSVDTQAMRLGDYTSAQRLLDEVVNPYLRGQSKPPAMVARMVGAR